MFNSKKDVIAQDPMETSDPAYTACVGSCESAEASEDEEQVECQILHNILYFVVS